MKNSIRRRGRGWHVSVHALSRLASRFNILPDMGVQAKIVNALNSGAKTLVTDRANGMHLYEIEILGIKVILVCKLESQVVVTVLDSKKYFRDIQVEYKYKRKGGGAPKGDEEE